MTVTVKQLTSRFYTNNPFEIAERLGFAIIMTSLIGVRGFYQYTKRTHIIYIDDNLNERDQKFVCAHELGHALLHRGTNRIFMDHHTGLITSRFEREANKFAVELTVSDDELEPFLEYPVERAASYFNLSEELVTYRMSLMSK